MYVLEISELYAWLDGMPVDFCFYKFNWNVSKLSSPSFLKSKWIIISICENKIGDNKIEKWQMQITDGNTKCYGGDYY